MSISMHACMDDDLWVSHPRVQFIYSIIVGKSGSLPLSLSLSLERDEYWLRERIEMSGQNQGLQVISYKAT